MIRLIEEETTAFAAFNGRDALGARVLAALRSYTGLAYDCAQFWEQTNENGSTTSVLSMIDGYAVLCADETADTEELAAFLQMQHTAGLWDRLHCDAALAQHLPFREEAHSCLLRFAAPLRAALPGLRVCAAQDPGEVYPLLKGSFAEVKNRTLWLADMALRWRRGTAQSWFLCRGNARLCTASALALTETNAFLGAVCTPAELRGQGFAGDLVAHIAIKEQQKGRTVFLSCAEEKRGFYHSIGFVEAGEWVMLQA